MMTIAYVEMNFFALLILLLIYINIRRFKERYLFEQKLFLLLLASNALMLILDSLMWLADGRPGDIGLTANTLITTLYFLAHPIPCLVWTLYASYMVYRDEGLLKKLLIPLLLPVTVNTVLVVMSTFDGRVFYFDENNVYHRGPLFIFVVLLYFSYLAYTFVFILIKHRRVVGGHYVPLLVFLIAPFIGGLIQTMFYGLSLIWSSTMISILIVFINTQNGLLYVDYLTGLFNRRQLDFFLQERISKGPRNTVLIGLMIDLDSFKEINDKFGHAAGDKALIDTGKTLRMSFGKNDLICRYGGDEFVVISEMDSETAFYDAMAMMDCHAFQMKQKENNPYSIRFSRGYAIYDWNSNMSAQAFLKSIDDLMYQDKNRIKQEFVS